jgi:hypothetical protein
MTLVNDATIWSIILESSIMLLESSIMLLENIYSTGIFKDNRHLQSTKFFYKCVHNYYYMSMGSTWAEFGSHGEQMVAVVSLAI